MYHTPPPSALYDRVAVSRGWRILDRHGISARLQQQRIPGVDMFTDPVHLQPFVTNVFNAVLLDLLMTQAVPA